MIHVLLIEDHPLVSEAASYKISLSPRVASIMVCGTADEALDALHAEPDRWGLILLDLDIPGAVGLSLATHIRKMGKAHITCVLTGSNQPEYVTRIEAQGFQGYICKGGASIDVLEHALLSVVGGQRVFPSRPETATAEGAVRLTARQTDCLQCVARGMTSRQIALSLKIHPSTVDRHINGAFYALGVKSRSHAVGKALELGLIDLP
ncbi:response regulator transcription factor [Variovorax saccharolyticus]|uniref:response regulator transcription factor n=1 Tax=Variovorax saccharolyticus TaxID=3053516 RepID=UPI002575A73E|nr:response regulator transcription factor [Variovorax sp. J31P216]MDM0030346.1 response regulator transcription factor [Variovorax sp. J31P216]